jgi:hypothetical protein
MVMMRNQYHRRPRLERTDLDEVLKFKPGTMVVTMSLGQWDVTLHAAYDAGCTLLELDDDEQPIAAYRKPTA